MNLLKQMLVTRVLAAQVDGTGTQSSDILDMAGWDGVIFMAKFDDVDNTATLTLRVQQNTANSASGMATLSGSATYTAAATDADDDLLILDIHKPRERYLRAQVVIGVANATTAAIIAIQHCGTAGQIYPVTQSSTVLDSDTLVSPAEA